MLSTDVRSSKQEHILEGRRILLSKRFKMSGFHQLTLWVFHDVSAKSAKTDLAPSVPRMFERPTLQTCAPTMFTQSFQEHLGFLFSSFLFFCCLLSTRTSFLTLRPVFVVVVLGVVSFFCFSRSLVVCSLTPVTHFSLCDLVVLGCVVCGLSVCV